METTLKLNLLGRPLIFFDDQVFNKLRVDKARALLFFLAATRRNHSREDLSHLLWVPHSGDEWIDLPDKEKARVEKLARDNLKTEIWRLRKLEPLEPYIYAERDVVGLNRDLPLDIDVEGFEACFPAGREPTVDQLETALKLYRGPFLRDFSARNAPRFDEWIDGQRFRLEGLAFQAFGQLARYYAARSDYAQSLRYIEDWLTYSPDDEHVHQCKLILLALLNETHRARDYYQQLNHLLRLETDLLPALMARLESGQITPEALDELLPPPPAAISTTAAPVIARPFMAPPRPDHLVGRIQEIDELKRHLAVSELKLIALVGMGGIGKTTLSIRFAYELRHVFEDGILWGDLTESAPMDILDLWGRAYGANDIGRLAGITNRAASFRNLMQHKHALIVIDDVKKAAQVEHLLPNNPDCVVLITTRSHYAVSQIEMMSRLTAKKFTLKGLARRDSLNLLGSMLGEGRVQDESEDAGALAELLGDHPLALEITAQRLKLRPDRALRREAQAFQAAESLLQNLTLGERAVRATFDQSWSLLDEVEEDGPALKRIFPRLGVFRERPFSLEAAAFVTEVQEEEADEQVNALCNLSLVNRGGRGRYRLHALLADFARQKLETKQRPHYLQRLAEYYQQYAARHKDSFGELDREWGGITAGTQTAYDFKDWRRLVDYAAALQEGLFGLGRFTDARRLYRWLCRSADDRSHNLEVIEQVGPKTIGDFYCQWALACIEQNAYEEASAQVANAEEVYEELNDRAGIARTKLLLGRIGIEINEPDAAFKALNLSLEICQEIGDQLGFAEASHQLAQLRFDQSQFTESEQYSKEALANFREIAFPIGIIKSLRLLADLALKAKDYSTAEVHCSEALIICDQINEQSDRTVVLQSLAISQWLQNRLESGLVNISKSIDLLVSIGDNKQQGRSYRIQASIYYAMQKLDEAFESAQHGLRLSRMVSDIGNCIMVLEVIAEIYVRQGLLNHALALCQEAYGLALEFGNEALTERVFNKLSQIEKMLAS
jgi:DNA-binding SARP family transcriptional activator